jgi:hypothetical protein
MSLPLAVASNLTLAAALVAGLSFAMTRSHGLAPHADAARETS